MAVVAQSADLAHAEHRLAPAGAEVGLALGQAPSHGFAAPRWRGVHDRDERVLGPRVIVSLAVGHDVEAGRSPARKGLRAPALAVKHQGDAPLGPDFFAQWRQDVALDRGQEMIVGLGGDEEPRLRPGVVDPDPRSLPACTADGVARTSWGSGAGDRGRGARARRYTGTPRPRLSVGPAPGKGVGQRARELARADFVQLAAHRLDLRRAVQAQQQSQFSRGMGLELLRARDPQTAP